MLSLPNVPFAWFSQIRQFIEEPVFVIDSLHFYLFFRLFWSIIFSKYFASWCISRKQFNHPLTVWPFVFTGSDAKVSFVCNQLCDQFVQLFFRWHVDDSQNFDIALFWATELLAVNLKFIQRIITFFMYIVFVIFALKAGI